jgi:hypothetical protein
MDRLSENEFLFIWEPILGPDDAWSEYCDYCLYCGIDEIDFDEDEED